MGNQNKVVIVTGASSGIGAATAALCTAKGYHVFGTSRQGAKGATSSAFEMLALDVTKDESVATFIKEVMKKAGRIDYLINNAGSGVYGSVEESSMDQAKHLFDTNVFGVARMAKAVLPIMRAQEDEGRIITVSSILGVVPAPFSALYSATKHALEGYCESMDHEIRQFGLRSLLVEPAFTRTSFDSNMVEADTPMPLYEKNRHGYKKLLTDMSPKADTPEIIAETILKAMTDTKPQIRYAAGQAKAISKLRRFLPASIFYNEFRKSMGLPKI